MVKFKTQVKVRFAHCDPAGIIFYPRYFEILNGVVEDWFDQALGYSFSQLMSRHDLATPMVEVQTKFLKPCRLDDILSIALSVEKVGSASAIIIVEANLVEKIHIQTRGVLVCSKRNLSSSAQWPNEIAKKMHTFLI